MGQKYRKTDYSGSSQARDSVRACIFATCLTVWRARVEFAQLRPTTRSISMTECAKSPLVVSAETAGLGNRLKSWVSAMRIGSEARVCWPVNKNMPAGFGDLFANDCEIESVPPGATLYSSWRLAVLPEDEPHLPVGFATVGAGAHPLGAGSAKPGGI